MMEMKSSMGVIVAAPTAGSCGALPGAILGVSDALDKNMDQRVDAMFAAGMIGVFIASGATFAAEEAGCMAECGSGASMGAAELFYSMGEATDSRWLQHQWFTEFIGYDLRYTRKPGGGTLPWKKWDTASNALSSANMALVDYDDLVPLDQVIGAMREVGNMMPRELCTGLGGSLLRRLRGIEEKLKGINN